MARSVVDAFLTEEQGSDVIRVINQNSAAETYFTPEPMKSYTKTIPRSGRVGVAVKPKGSAYTEDSGTVDEITIVAKTFGVAVRIAEEDLEDEIAGLDVINEKKIAAGNSFAVTIDNATLATTAVSNGTTVPFNSVYYAVTHADASVSYTANANYVATAGSGAAVTYDQLRSVVAKFELSPFFDPTNAVAIAHPSFKDALRGIKDTQGHPIFTDPIGGAASTFFGYDMKFSLGAKTSATATDSPTGNPLIIVANRSLLRLGKRSGPESAVIDGRTGLSALTDEALMIFRARRGFVLGDVRAAAVLENLQ